MGIHGFAGIQSLLYHLRLTAEAAAFESETHAGSRSPARHDEARGEKGGTP
jgi:hypothetical protein